MPDIGVRYGHMLQEYMVARVREIDRERRERRAAVKTRADVARLQDEIRRAIRKSFGPMPARTPLNLCTTDILDRSRYTVENLIYESRPGFPVTANLYVPKGLESPAPCVLGTCGHTREGKAAPGYQAFVQGLARKGFVVLIYDPISQGERVQYAKRDGTRRIGLTAEHSMMGNQMGMVGDFFGSWRAWDGIRSLDVLLARNEVDPTRVGLTGNSGGGTMTTWLTGLDRRFTMAAPGCFVTTLLCNLENELGADSEQTPPGILGLGVDPFEFYIPHAPKPLILLTAKRDFFDQRGAQQAYRELGRIYRILGAADNLQIAVGPGTHGYRPELREAMYGFFTEHAGLKRSPKEPRIRVELERDLLATRTGQVVREGARKVVDFTRDKSGARREKRGHVAAKKLPMLLKKVLVLPQRTSPPHHRILAPFTIEKTRYQPFALETEPGIQTIAIVKDAAPERTPPPAGKRCDLVVPHKAALDELTHAATRRLFGRTRRVFALDVRGAGLSVPMVGMGLETTAPHGADYFYHEWSLMLGEPVLGRRVHDVLATLDWLAALGYDDIHLIGRGIGSITALLAAAVDSRPSRVTLVNPLLSLEDLIDVDIHAWPASVQVSGILEHFDLPDCYRALGKKVKVLSPWDAQMKPLKVAEARRRLGETGLRLSTR